DRARPATERSGDIALLLAVRGVFRRLHVLLQRTARSARLGVLLGRRRCASFSAASSSALHARISGAAESASLIPFCGRSGSASLLARGCAWNRTHRGDDPGGARRLVVLVHNRVSRSHSSAVLPGLCDVGARGAGPRVSHHYGPDGSPPA